MRLEEKSFQSFAIFLVENFMVTMRFKKYILECQKPLPWSKSSFYLTKLYHTLLNK